jgi:peptidoglycan/LPS O-acetylase OafA/YrhL
MLNPQQSRNAALDLLRAIAITMVFAYHYKAFVSHEPTFGWISVVGWLGVDLFFVLSGYLIGNQIFSAIGCGDKLSITNFYARRALRTWPAFWVVLALYFLFPNIMGGRQPPPLWSFLTFTQNWGLRPSTAFSHAWSLCIEEQFYFVLPLFVLVALRIGNARWQAWGVLALLLAVGVMARAWLWQKYGREALGQIDGYYPNLYYSTLGRFDEFLPGVAIALLKNCHVELWRRIERHVRFLLLLGVAASAAIFYGAYHFYYIENYGYGFFMSVFGYSLAAIAFSILVMAALCSTSPLRKWRLPGVYHVALWSYSIYLTHKPVAYIINVYGKQHAFTPSMTLAITLPASLLIGALLYQVVELPFLMLRDRYFVRSSESYQLTSQVPSFGSFRQLG